MKVQARCPRCTSTACIEAAQLVVALPAGAEPVLADVLFTCPSCGSSPRYQVPRLVALSLAARGAGMLRAAEAPLPSRHPESPPAGAAPFTPDDLLDLHEQLADGRLLRALIAEEA